MKIVITRLGDCLIADGLNVFIYELSDALIQLGQEVHLLAGTTANVPIGGSVSTFEKTVREMFSVERVPNLISLSDHMHGQTFSLRYLEMNLLFTFKGPGRIKEISPDMVIFNGATMVPCNCFTVAVATDLEFRLRIAKSYDSLAYRTFDRIVAASTELKQEIVRQLQFPSAKITVIPVCIDTSKFSPQPRSKRMHAILHVGTRPEKRPDITINAFEKIAREDSELELFIAGQIAPLDLAALSEIKRKEKSISERISILGRISKEKLAELNSLVKVTCVPSDYGVPVCSPTVLESLASGTPVVGSFSAISKDILIDGYNGFRVQPNNVEMFASRLKLLIGNDDLGNKMSKNALLVAKSCDKLNVARDYLSLYRENKGDFLAKSENRK